MISIYNDVITKSECFELINWYKTNLNLVVSNLNDNLYHFEGINIIEKINDFTFTKRFLKNSGIDRIRIQNVNPSTPMVEIPHGHVTPYSFIIFLNDDFTGGELIFENINIKPKSGQIVYFTGEERHYVKKVNSGDRFTLVSFLNSHITIQKPNLL